MPWMSQLAAVTCLSLAAKDKEIQVPFLLDLQVCGMCIVSLCNVGVCKNVSLYGLWALCCFIN